jgi:hypothetical protein
MFLIRWRPNTATHLSSKRHTVAIIVAGSDEYSRQLPNVLLSTPARSITRCTRSIECSLGSQKQCTLDPVRRSCIAVLGDATTGAIGADIGVHVITTSYAPIPRHMIYFGISISMLNFWMVLNLLLKLIMSSHTASGSDSGTATLTTGPASCFVEREAQYHPVLLSDSTNCTS